MRGAAGCVLAALLVAAPTASAADRYAVVVTGASGGESYTLQYDTWRNGFVATLHSKFGFDAGHLAVLGETEGAGVLPATRLQVQKTLADLARRLTRDDFLFVLLIGHGTSANGEEAKFNLVGPDLSASEWADLLRPIPARLAFVNTTGASFPFMAKVAGRGRLVLTATDSAMQQFDTVFPEFFVKGFDDPSADADKNGRASIWEVFNYASAKVKQWFEERGRLPTERPVLDDDGDGIGREAQNPGRDGTIATAMYLDAGGPGAAVPVGGANEALLRTRADLEAKIEALKGARTGMAAEAFNAELERLLTELARVSQQLR